MAGMRALYMKVIALGAKYLFLRQSRFHKLTVRICAQRKYIFAAKSVKKLSVKRCDIQFYPAQHSLL